MITDMIPLCSDISSGSSDGEGRMKGRGSFVQLQLLDEKQMKDRKHR